MLAFCVPRDLRILMKGGVKMLALFIFLAVLIIAHGLAIGAYLTIYKMKAQTIVGRTAGTLIIGTAYSVVAATVTAIILLPPIG